MRSTRRAIVAACLSAPLFLAGLLSHGCGEGAGPVGPATRRPARNIILMIADGAGFNAFDCAAYYEHGRLGRQVYDRFPVRVACTTYMLRAMGDGPGYDPRRAWRDFDHCRGSESDQPTTDSAAAATALYTGVKTQGGRCCVVETEDGDLRRLKTIAEYAHGRGMGAGVVTSVQISHATPACFWAHNESRNRYRAIAREMILDSGLDVICGCGHPEYFGDGLGDDGRWGRNYAYVGGEDLWGDIKAGKVPGGWTFVDAREDFERIASDPDEAPRRLLGVARCNRTLQYDRPDPGMGGLNDHVPDLPTLSLAALNVLARKPGGFVLMIEGGAVDWANHANRLGRMVTEMIDFNRAVEAVVGWVEAHGSWDETLLIVTSDHECGWLWGPEAGGPANFQPPVNRGKGRLPLAKYFSGGHTNAPVPLYAVGAGAARFRDHVRGRDPKYGPFVDNTDVFKVMRASLPPARAARAAPAPAAAAR